MITTNKKIHASLPWRVVPLTEANCHELCTWRYSPPYDLYNWSPWENMLQDQAEFADPQIRAEQYRAVLDEDGLLSGFVQFFPIVGVTRLGLGLRPDLCGKGSGIGTQFVQLLVQEAQRRMPQQEIDLEVLVWNKRAIQTYERAGFTITDTYDKRTPTGIAAFHCMVYNGPSLIR
ncbi:GNAT family N-acetyltransferase [Paenibacillus alginolyticus]|uniref:GNAT family N-acetyltransferase n=1 Tax=Paenibacillus alginolyticus TaxID=59839 RepID=A0ABT4GJW1_9BACL|nr:GNAT family N-acetyltransferase [Paenibacillus alginolyticus]MCY9696476.1 GNAT family N-acetyltransferase [Paenibacillus alginolyticus]MEC0144740.1 GNAT family N-acetyltransferase [Paenibacillus alginolyticus]